jgi:diguanylate cyclase (GGDEF)-like protein/PAS domain S-box-containing protein
VKHWTDVGLVLTAACVAVAQWLVPTTMQGMLGGLLLGLVILTIFSQRGAMQHTLDSRAAAHEDQLESERRYRALFDACSDAILVYSLEDDGRPGALKEANEAACRMLGYSRAQLLSMAAEKVYAPEESRSVLERSRALQDAGTLAFETVQATSRGQRLPVEVSARMVTIGGRKLCLAVSHSIAAQKEREGILLRLSDRDELTGLLNRRGFFARVDEARRQARRDGAQAFLLYLDVDDLKRVNDEMGHASGDEEVVAAADALRLAFREQDVLARLGGDEFVALAVLGKNVDERLDCQAIRARLEQAVRAKRAELGDDYAFSVSYGSVVANSDELGDIDELLALTDQRMYKAKGERRRASSSMQLVGQTS